MKLPFRFNKTFNLDNTTGVIILNALVIILLILSSRTPNAGIPLVHWGLMSAAVMVTLIGLFLRRWSRDVHVLFTLFLIDIPLITLIIHYVGGIDSILSFLYLPLIITASVFLNRKPVYAIGLLSVTAYIILCLAERSVNHLSLIYITNRFSLLGLLYLMTAILSSTIAERYRGRSEEVRQLMITTEEIIKNLPSGIIIIDRSGDIRYTNIPPGPIQSRIHLQLARYLRYVETPALAELKIKGRYYYLTCARINHNQAALAVLQDLTDLRRLEEKSRVSRQTRMLAELGGSLAHELRNPLSSIQGALELLAQANRDANITSFIELAVKESHRLNQIVTDFLHFAQFTPGKMNRITISEVLTEAILESTRQFSHRSVELARQGEDYHILADLERLKSVFINILNNAIEISRDDQRIVIITKRFRQFGAVDIIDEGPGITSKDLPRIFTPFFTTKKGGTGLGLAIAQKVIEAHQGRITVRSAVGKGTRFRILLPLA